MHHSWRVKRLFYCLRAPSRLRWYQNKTSGLVNSYFKVTGVRLLHLTPFVCVCKGELGPRWQQHCNLCAVCFESSNDWRRYWIGQEDDVADVGALKDSRGLFNMLKVFKKFLVLNLKGLEKHNIFRYHQKPKIIAHWKYLPTLPRCVSHAVCECCFLVVVRQFWTLTFGELSWSECLVTVVITQKESALTSPCPKLKYSIILFKWNLNLSSCLL